MDEALAEILLAYCQAKPDLPPHVMGQRLVDFITSYEEGLSMSAEDDMRRRVGALIARFELELRELWLPLIQAIPKPVDPELEKLLDEEEKIERNYLLQRATSAEADLAKVREELETLRRERRNWHTDKSELLAELDKSGDSRLIRAAQREIDELQIKMLALSEEIASRDRVIADLQAELRAYAQRDDGFKRPVSEPVGNNLQDVIGGFMASDQGQQIISAGKTLLSLLQK